MSNIVTVSRENGFKRALAGGADQYDAKWQADQWEKRQHADRWSHCCSTHCERSQECRGPGDCCASLKHLRAGSPSTVDGRFVTSATD